MEIGRGRPNEQDPTALARVRVPAPLIPYRLPSGRGATEQPNATSDGDAPLTPRLWVAVVCTAVITGVCATALMWVLFSVQHLTYRYGSGELVTAVERASDAHRVLALVIAGVVGAAGLTFVRRVFRGESTDVDGAIWSGDAKLGARLGITTALLSELVIGMGASLGREAAPKLVGGIAGGACATRAGLTAGQRRLVMACGAGAGLACVYNVPLAGALYIAEVLLGTVALPTILPAVCCTCIATMATWIYLPDAATYVGVPDYPFSPNVLAWAVVAGPLIGLASAAYIRLVGWTSHHQVRGNKVLVTLPVALGILGCVGIAFPQLFGNGKDIAHAAFLGRDGLALLCAIAMLKPLVTMLCLGGGGSGGLFTPTLSFGAALGGALGGVWSLFWHGVPIGAYAMVGASALLASSLQAPLTALALVFELTRSGFGLTVPMMVAAVGATVVARHVDGYSIYTARLPAERRPPVA